MSRGHKEEIELSNVIVNPDNYRFEPVEDEQKALKTMMDSLGSEVSNLARDIVEHGLNPLRTPLAVKKDGKYIVLDGNRRTTALKLLDNPELITGNYPLKQVFVSLKAKGYTAPKKLEFVIYDENDLKEADQWVLVEHNGKNNGVGTVSWGTKEKARFSARHNKTKLDKALQLTDYLEQKGVNTQKLDQTTLNTRILSDPNIRKRIGVDFVEGTLVIDDEKKNLPHIKKLIAAMSHKDFRVRDVYSKLDRAKWIDEVLPEEKAGSGGSEKGDRTGKTDKKSTKKEKRTFLGLIDPSDQISEKLPGKIIDIHHELININVTKTPHATAALMRVYMELVATDYLIECLSFQRQGENLRDSTGAGTFNELKAKLSAIQSDAATPRDIKSSLTVLLKKDLVTVQFNQVMHSDIFKATEADLRSLWTNLKPVLYYISEQIAKTK